ncbi:MAG: dihydropteroate synthase [Candidatus Omnitrophica bacterium]|nr:dihydropteroate synthase [Candidatus Omnitrophota bacterium]
MNGFPRPRVMGILNVTPDSFSDGGKFTDPAVSVERGREMAAEGAELIDIGGESTRPGAAAVPLQEELRRVIPVIEALSRTVAVPLSIDTSKAAVAAAALHAGATMVNDVTALRGDPEMAAVAARAKASVILMHMRGTPRTMQHRPRYRDVVADVMRWLREAAERAEAAGIARSRIFIDPGIGFGKTVTHNLEILRGLPQLVDVGYPVVLGASRKSFIGNMLDAEVDDRLAGSLACAAHAARCGVAIVRVHDVKPTVDLLRMIDAINNGTATHDARLMTHDQCQRQHVSRGSCVMGHGSP